MNGKEMPIGFAMALAMNETAMETFAGMSLEKREAVIERARSASSRNEMQQVVNSLSN